MGGSRARNSFRSFTQILLSFSLRILFLIFLLFLLLQGVKLAYSYGHGLLYEHAMEKEPGREVELEIKQGDSSSDIAKKLEKLGLIDNEEAFVLKAKLYHSSLLPGTYSLSTAMTQVQMLDFITEEGKKNQELSDKNLLKDEETEAESSEEDVIGAGNENALDSETTGKDGNATAKEEKPQVVDAGAEGE